MINKWQPKKLGEIIIGIIFVIASVFLFSRCEYGLSVLLLLALLMLHKADALTEFAFSLSDGVRAKFQTSPEKIEENIKENYEPITNQNFVSFRNIETKILSMLQKRYGGEMKTLIHYMYGQPDKPEFSYTPDASLMTKDTLYFFEIKYILKPEFAKNIAENTIKYLSEVYKKVSPSIGGKKFVIKLILASESDISSLVISALPGIDIEFYQL